MIMQIFFIIKFISVVYIFSKCDAKRPSRILEHVGAAPGEFPYMISLRRNNFHICGGAIITSRHILTAAHCFIQFSSINEFTVITGATRNSEIGEIHLIKSVIPYSNFIPQEYFMWHHDIAIITLEDEIIFHKFQNPIALPHTNTPGNIIGLLSGWGNYLWNDKKSGQLKGTEVAIITNEDCNKKYMKTMDTQMCGINGKQTGFCSGDSGSPLVYNNEIIGIVSFTYSCNFAYPNFYTRVFEYMDFISQIINTT